MQPRAPAGLLTAAALYPVVRRLLERLGQLSVRLLDANLETLSVLGSAVAKRDSDTDAHNYRATVYAVRLAEAAGLAPGRIPSLIKGAFLHDVGKIGIRDGVLLKPGRLDPAEFEEMKRHVPHGLEIVGRAGWLEDAADVVGHHHEKYDGGGYGRSLRGADIPLNARIFAIADVFDAVTSDRPYHEPMALQGALSLLDRGRGTHFDPALLDVFLGIAPDLHAAFANKSEEPRRELESLVGRYFHGGLAELAEEAGKRDRRG